jgi:predicted lipid-binding transport protein (Tim44 family)
MHDSFDMTTIIFAVLAVFVIWKLRSVLGERSGTEKPPKNPFGGNLRDVTSPPPSAEANNVITLPRPGAEPRPLDVPQGERGEKWKVYLQPGSNAAEGLEAIAAADRSFDIAAFIAGAKSAYEMIVTGFATGNRTLLENLLTAEVYANFAHALDRREKRGEKVQTTLISIDKVLIETASLNGPAAQIKLHYVASIVTATFDTNGKLIEGDPEKVQEIADVWTYMRQVDARDPNWKLSATETGH